MKNRQLEYDEISNEQRKFPICLVLDALHTPGNVGMIFRLAEAFGVERIFLCNGSIAPPNRKVVKAARSTIKGMPFEIHDDFDTVIASLRNDGYSLVGLEITSDSVDIRHFDFEKTEKIALFAGAERFGISAEVLTEMDACVEINLFGTKTSLNVATAVGIALFELTRLL